MFFGVLGDSEMSGDIVALELSNISDLMDAREASERDVLVDVSFILHSSVRTRFVVILIVRHSWYEISCDLLIGIA